MLYVPRLDDALFFITEHIKYNNFSFIENNNKYTLNFATFSIPAMIINEAFIPNKYVPNNNELISFSTKSSHDILNNNDQRINNKITTIPFTIEISIFYLKSHSTIYSLMSKNHNRKKI